VSLAAALSFNLRCGSSFSLFSFDLRLGFHLAQEREIGDAVERG